MSRTLSYDAELQEDGRYLARLLLKDSETGAVIEDLTDRPGFLRNAQNTIRELDPDAVFVGEAS